MNWPSHQELGGQGELYKVELELRRKRALVEQADIPPGRSTRGRADGTPSESV